MSTTIYEDIEELKKLDVRTVEHFSFDGQCKIARVTRVYDGDTFHCTFKHNGKFSIYKIRMAGYDSPELKPNKTRYSNEECLNIKTKANNAKNYLCNLIHDQCVILLCSKFDKYGRILAVVYNIDKQLLTSTKTELLTSKVLGGNSRKSINNIMIEEKHGVPYFGGKKET